MMLLMSIGIFAVAYIGTIERSTTLDTYRTGTTSTYTQPAAHAPKDGGLVQRLIIVEAIVLIIGGGVSIYFIHRVLIPIRRAHQAQAMFAANAHHQLRTPIATMQTELEVALLQTPIGRQKEVLMALGGDVETLRRVSEQLLTYAHFENKQLQLTGQQLEEVAKPIGKRFKISLEVTADRKARTTLRQDELQLILEILLENSLKHSGKSLRNLRVTLSLVRQKQYVLLKFSDNGRGVSSQERKRVFKRHYRGDYAISHNIPGTGIGLALIADLAKMHRGHARIKANATHGFMFELQLPAK